MLDLTQALAFMRRIYRDSRPGQHWWQKRAG
jgi:hypothetical protein